MDQNRPTDNGSKSSFEKKIWWLYLILTGVLFIGGILIALVAHKTTGILPE